MPLYEYECEACGHRFEVIQKFSDAPVAKCPSCGGSVRKLQSAPAFQFKGTGWYVTDYAKSGGSEKSDTDGKGEKDKKDDKEKKAESKGGKTEGSSEAGKSDARESSKTSASSGSSSSPSPSSKPND